MIYKFGNLVDADEDWIMHGCNSHGVMGSGVALAIRQKWPIAFETYRDAYERDGLTLGKNYYCMVEGNGVPTKMIINAITQKDFGRDKKQFVDYDAIRSCVKEANHMGEILCGIFNISPKIALPKIGAGLGGGDWAIISKILEEEFTYLEAVIYEIKT